MRDTNEEVALGNAVRARLDHSRDTAIAVAETDPIARDRGYKGLPIVVPSLDARPASGYPADQGPEVATAHG